MSSELYAAAKQTAIITLTRTAREGRIEALFIYDRETGEQLAYTEATLANPDEVSMDANVLKGHVNVAALHNHRDASPPGADDWANFLGVAAFQEVVVVTSAHVFTLVKPAERVASQQSEPFKQTFFCFLAKIESLRRALGYPLKFVDLSAKVREQLLWDTNQWMAVRFGIRLTREETP